MGADKKNKMNEKARIRQEKKAGTFRKFSGCRVGHDWEKPIGRIVAPGRIHTQDLSAVAVLALQSFNFLSIGGSPMVLDSLTAYDAAPKSKRFPGTFVCSRSEGEIPNAVWLEGESCSFCGCLHPDVVMERLEAGSACIDATDKDYKIYVHPLVDTLPFQSCHRAKDCPGGSDPSKWVWEVENTTQAKSYFQHFTTEQRKRFVELLNEGKIKFKGEHGFYVLPFFIQKGQS